MPAARRKPRKPANSSSQAATRTRSAAVPRCHSRHAAASNTPQTNAETGSPRAATNARRQCIDRRSRRKTDSRRARRRGIAVRMDELVEVAEQASPPTLPCIRTRYAAQRIRARAARARTARRRGSTRNCRHRTARLAAIAAPAKTLVGCTRTAANRATMAAAVSRSCRGGKTHRGQRKIPDRQRRQQRLAGIPGETAIRDVDRQHAPGPAWKSRPSADRRPSGTATSSAPAPPGRWPSPRSATRRSRA